MPTTDEIVARVQRAREWKRNYVARNPDLWFGEDVVAFANDEVIRELLAWVKYLDQESPYATALSARIAELEGKQ